LKIKITISGNSESCSYVELFHSCIWEREDVLSVTDNAHTPITHVYMQNRKSICRIESLHFIQSSKTLSQK